ncbi:MAG: hypothetical protein KY455_11860 [Euryarchaeota archaeon]|nr:hypothetical protein [Euryarchaeota archaeon]
MGSRTLLLVLVVALVPIAPLPSGAASHEGLPDILWLRPDPAGGRSHNFTTYAPASADDGSALEVFGGSNTSTISFATPWLPAEWQVEPDIGVSVELWVSGLDGVIAATDPQSFVDAPGRVTVRVELRHGSEGVFARGETTVETDPVQPDETPRQLTFDLRVERAVRFESDPDTGDGLRLEVTVMGYHRSEDPVSIHVLSPETPSHIVLESFPIGAFRAWEDQEAVAAACHRAIQEGRTCAPAETEEPDGERRRETPAPLSWFLGLTAILAATAGLLWIGRRH